MTELGSLSRRSLIAGTAGLAGAAALAPRGASAQASPPANAQLGTPASTITTPPRDWSPGHPSIYPDPDVIVVDPSFRQLAPGNSAVRRLWTGAQWAEGPAWSSQGQYLVFSDVTGNTQYRYIWEDGRVTAFRRPSNNTNGNSVDFEGRQLSCEDFNRRVVRWEHDGSLKARGLSLPRRDRDGQACWKRPTIPAVTHDAQESGLCRCLRLWQDPNGSEQRPRREDKAEAPFGRGMEDRREGQISSLCRLGDL